MYDFHKCNLYGIHILTLVKNELLNFFFNVDEKTGEPNNWKEAELNGLKFKLWDSAQLYLQGSFHKYFNGGTHNYNDFTISNFADVLINFSTYFQVNPYKTDLHNLEFGANIILPFSCEKFLNTIVSYKNLLFDRKTFGGEGYLIKYKLQQYELKIYDKGKQFGLGDNILRVEIKVTRMEYLKSRSINISNYADLLDPVNIHKLSQLLIDTFNQLLIYDDSINCSKLQENEKMVLIEGSNPDYWKKYQKENPENCKKRKTRFKKLVLKHGAVNYQKVVYELLASKLDAITLINPETQLKIGNYLEKYSEQKTFPELTAPIQIDVPRINTSYSMLETGTEQPHSIQHE